MKYPAKPLMISYAIFGVAIAALIASTIVGAIQAKPALEAFQEAQKTSQSENPIAPQTAQEAVENEPGDVSQSAPTDTPQTSSITNDTPAPDQGGHIPFTQEPVTPGDPASYQNTVGQCPFYEMGGDKGCIPPADIECNADWSECHPRNTDGL